MPDAKKTLVFIIACLVSFFAGFFARGLFDGGGVSDAVQYHNAIEGELGEADGARSRIENNVTSAGDGIENGLEYVKAIGSGLDGIERYAVENTELLDRALGILQNAGERKSQIKIE
jgi:hypothetical protein